MGLSASQGRLLLLTARRSDLEYRAQQISQKRLVLSQQLEEISLEYENATSNRQMKISLFNSSETDSNGDAINRTMNLTYAALISGLSVHGEEKTGIQQSDYVQGNGWQSNNAYRLVSTDGAIVVSHVDEIPSVCKQEKTTSSVSEAYATQEGEAAHNGQVYTVSKTTPGQDGNPATTTKLAIVPTYDKENPSDLYKALNGSKSKTTEVQYDTKNGIVQVGEGDSAKFYSIADGKETDNVPNDVEFQEAALYANKSDVPKSTVTEDTSYEYGDNLVEGNDGCYTLYDENGNVVNRYIVDESLRLGMTDSAGTYDGPNYLQDCLRNGKYLLEQFKTDANNDDGYRWSSVSWDATSNISDSYYTEDDDAAKAKYDRLQTQIQAQDKKLELELDAIETQRSAVTTEVESVEKVINEDIEGTFNAFG